MVIRGIGYRFFYVQNDIALSSTERSQACRLTTPLSSSSSNLFEEELFDDEHPLYWNNTILELAYNRYLVIRAGHTTDRHLPLPYGVFVKTSKKDRKLTIFGKNKQLVFDIAHQIYEYRKPSAYTGRGVRRKQIKVLRKVGKRDKQ